MQLLGLCVLVLALLCVEALRLEFDAEAFGPRDRRQFLRQLQHVQRMQQQQQIVTPARIETFTDLVRPLGYHVEEHDVTTDDGYILTVHRIPGGPKSPVSPNKPVVLLIHGVLAASDIWALRGPDRDIAFMLVDAGYDLWFLNMRGNYYSRRHKRLVPKEEKFWKFSWHESGVYDTPAVIDHILRITEQKKLSIICHSMGCTIGLVTLSLRPEYNAKVNVMLHFAPIAIFTHLLPGPIGVIGVRYGRQLQKTLRMLGVHEVAPRNPMHAAIYTAMCGTQRMEILCQKIIFNSFGLFISGEFDIIDPEIMIKAINHYPQGSSVDTLVHYRQLMLSGKFRQYDFGPDGNYLRYKNSTPPEYPLEKITVPNVLYYGLNDAYSTKEDILALIEKLPNAEGRALTHERFSHLDFIVSYATGDELYVDAMRTLDLYREDRVGEAPTLSRAIEFLRLAPTTVTV